MSSRYAWTPRAYLTDRQRRFGQGSNLADSDWKEPSTGPLDVARLKAAKFQHEFAVAVFAEKGNYGLSLEDIADRSGIPLATLRAILNGTRPVTLPEVYALEPVCRMRLI